ncbi:glycosyltransferase family 2 protein [Hyphomonas sp.]|jgi:glycosyltransferase involved in cell wall biosynthesis|uniref:glycosyltransferase family 2 protein n=1 Tax=Hyphomonas sp. TaxID=87 RepID=UPI0037C04DF4
MKIPENFDWFFYINYYKDLKKSHIKTKAEALHHYFLFGSQEQRKINFADLTPLEKENFLIKWEEINQNQTRLKNFKNFKDSDLEIIRNHNLKTSKISVIISLYNYANFIESAIQSVLNNEFEDCEIVVINDNSTDNSLELSKSFLSKNCNLTIINKKLNTGLSHTRNLGIHYCVGEYVFILDADNTIYPNCLNNLFKFIKNKNLDAAYATIECFDEDKNFIKYISNKEFDLNEIKDANYIDAMAMFKKQTLIMEKYSVDLLNWGTGYEDYELWLRLGSKNYKIGHLNECLSRYLIKSDRMISKTLLFKEELEYFFLKKYG